MNISLRRQIQRQPYQCGCCVYHCVFCRPVRHFFTLHSLCHFRRSSAAFVVVYTSWRERSELTLKLYEQNSTICRRSRRIVLRRGCRIAWLQLECLNFFRQLFAKSVGIALRRQEVDRNQVLCRSAAVACLTQKLQPQLIGLNTEWWAKWNMVFFVKLLVI